MAQNYLRNQALPITDRQIMCRDELFDPRLNANMAVETTLLQSNNQSQNSALAFPRNIFGSYGAVFFGR